MSGNTGSGTGQEPGTGDQGQGQEPGSQQDQNGGQGQEPGGQQQGGPADITTMKPEELATYAARLQKDAEEARREAANYRTQFQTAQQKVTEQERASMTEAQRIQADLEAAQTARQELETRVKDLTVGSTAREALGKAKAINPSVAFKLLDLSAVETGPDGTPKADQLQAAITALKTSDPYLFQRSARADAGEGGGGAPDSQVSINDFVRGRR